MALELRAAALAAALAGTTILAAPASAAPLASGITTPAASTTFAPSRFDPVADSTQWGCRWGCGWGRRGWHGGWRRNRVDAGDVLIGAAIIGGVLAIANSERRREREREVVVIDRDPRYRDRDDRRIERRDDRRTGSAGLDNAVDMCLDRIERDVRVDTVDNVRRNAGGWEVTGSVFNGARFACRIGNNGQIDSIDYDGTFGAGDWREPQASADAPAAGQWDDQSYAQLRAGIGGTVRPDIAVQETEVRGGLAVAPATARGASAAQPTYPGGPIPGEVIPETLEEATGG